MKLKVIKSDALLIITAAIWGFAFVAQRAGNEFIGPFLYNSLRFTIGCLFLLPFILRKRTPFETPDSMIDLPLLLRGGIFAGILLFAGASLQQFGLVFTTAGKAGFITGLYVVFVPILTVFWKHKVPVVTWIGSILAVIGLYLLSVREGFRMEPGDLPVLIGSFVWAGHVLIIGRYSPRVDPLRIAFIQFAITAIFSTVVAIIFEEIIVADIIKAAYPVLYGGIMSAGIAFTLQIVAQKDAPASHAAVILSLEAVFAAIGGWLLLKEVMDTRAIIGCVVVFSAMLVSQLYKFNTATNDPVNPENQKIT